jgi:hypothetical protein
MIYSKPLGKALRVDLISFFVPLADAQFGAVLNFEERFVLHETQSKCVECRRPLCSNDKNL